MELESLLALSGSSWVYALILLVAASDVLVPIVPSEATVIAAGVLAGAGELEILFVIAAGAVGAYAGDSTAYWIGRGLAPRFGGRLFRGAKGSARRGRAEAALRRHGAVLIFGARFVPGGRTAATVTSGVIGMTWVRFGIIAAVAGAVWATYAGLVGYLGGRAFDDNVLFGLVVGFGIAAGVFVGVEAVRRIASLRS